MRRIVALAALLVTTDVWAVTPRSWTTATAEEFLAGEISQIGLTASGSLVSAPATKRIAGVTDPFVLSQTSDGRGRTFLGTGNAGKVYSVDRAGTVKELFTAPEPEIYAVAWHDGRLYAASSPWGSVYRIDPATGESSAVWKSEHAYIWSLLPDANGGLLAATGLEGGIYRIAASGSASRLWSAPETHIRSLARTGDGAILAGGSGEGRIYRIEPSGSGTALFDSSLTEISAVAWSNSGGWAAASAGTLPQQAPQRPDQSRPNQQSGSSGSQENTSGEQQPAATVDVSFSFNDAQQGAPPAPPAGNSELYRVHPDGYVELLRKFDREIIYALAPVDGGVLVGTGPQGRIYRVTDDTMTLLGSVTEKQIVSLLPESNDVLVTTSNAGALYRLGGSGDQSGTWTSPARDASIFSRWGAWNIEGRGLGSGSVTVAFRSGNSATPDETWSAWSESRGTAGSVTAPAARYLQYRVSLAGSSPDARIDRVHVAYLQRNVRPVIESLAVHEPGVVFISGGYPQAPQVVEATNPDEYGIFTSLETPRDRTDPGKRMFRKGYRTVAWKARDENGDTLTYDVEFRPEGGSWMRMRENLQDSQLNFDSAQLPDGTYEIRVTAHDRKDNPDAPASSSRAGVFFEVDNASPAITSTRRGNRIEVEVRDQRSPIIRVEMAVGAREWVRLLPEDGIADSRSERFTVDAPAADAHVMVRAVDAQYNVTTARVGAP